MIKLTKTELRVQQHKLTQLQKYLPTLQLKKMLLQVEVYQAQQDIQSLNSSFQHLEAKISGFSSLFSDKQAFDLFPAVKVLDIKKKSENIAGLDLPVFENVTFQESDYFLFDSPVWLEAGISALKELIEIKEKRLVAEERKRVLEKELKDVSIRVNLFEKILIPRALQNIKKIKIFLGDQLLAAVAQAKVSKEKILKRAHKES